ncbi:MAG: hypothetical protein M0Z67_16720 [Nitrospiraceae bacterium]|nr:hypothetical protein [Nitrospiraceae bacterium]
MIAEKRWGMKAREIFESSVKVMKMLLTKDEMMESIRRAKERGEEGNTRLLDIERGNVNELVRRIVKEKGPREILKAVPQARLAAVVIRYLRNREIFMKTFPQGVEDAAPDPLAIWAAVMISPGDEKPDA